MPPVSVNELPTAGMINIVGDVEDNVIDVDVAIVDWTTALLLITSNLKEILGAEGVTLPA